MSVDKAQKASPSDVDAIMSVCGRLDRAACVQFEEAQPAPLDASPVPIPDIAPTSQVPAPTPGRSSTVASTLDANMWGQLSDSEAEPVVATPINSLAFLAADNTILSLAYGAKPLPAGKGAAVYESGT